MHEVAPPVEIETPKVVIEPEPLGHALVMNANTTEHVAVRDHAVDIGLFQSGIVHRHLCGFDLKAVVAHLRHFADPGLGDPGDGVPISLNHFRTLHKSLAGNGPASLY